MFPALHSHDCKEMFSTMKSRQCHVMLLWSDRFCPHVSSVPHVIAIPVIPNWQFRASSRYERFHVFGHCTRIERETMLLSFFSRESFPENEDSPPPSPTLSKPAVEEAVKPGDVAKEDDHSGGLRGTTFGHFSLDHCSLHSSPLECGIC